LTALPPDFPAILVVGNSEGRVIAWNLQITPIGVLITADARELFQMGCHTGAVTAVTVHEKGEQCASGGSQMSLCECLAGGVIREFCSDAFCRNLIVVLFQHLTTAL